MLHGLVGSGLDLLNSGKPGTRPRLEYRADIDPAATFCPCAPDSFDEFLLERYTAFNGRSTCQQAGDSVPSGRKSAFKRFFRIWHPPWPQTSVDILSLEVGILTESWPWFADARLVGAHYSPGIRRVWMGRPKKCAP
jgi:hypothetical protein